MIVEIKYVKENIVVKGYWNSANPNELCFYDEFGFDNFSKFPRNIYDDVVQYSLFNLFENLKGEIFYNYQIICDNCCKYMDVENVHINFFYFDLYINY